MLEDRWRVRKRANKMLNVVILLTSVTNPLATVIKDDVRARTWHFSCSNKLNSILQLSCSIQDAWWRKIEIQQRSDQTALGIFLPHLVTIHLFLVCITASALQLSKAKKTKNITLRLFCRRSQLFRNTELHI